MSDRLLVEFDIESWEDEAADVAYLAWMQRNSSPELKGLGEEVYRNLVSWLKARDWRFLISMPLSTKLETYWTSVGQVPVSRVRPEKKCLLTRPDNTAQLFVHFLYEDDKREFLQV